MKKQLPLTRRKRQKTAQQSLKRYHWSRGTLDTGEYKTAPEQYPTTPRVRTETEATRPKDFGWINS